MSEPVTIWQRVRRLIRYRYPLVVAAALNGLFLVGVPAMKPRAVTQAATTASDPVSKNSSRSAPSEEPKGEQADRLVHLERKPTHPESRGDGAGKKEALRSTVVGPLRKDAARVQRLRGVSQTVWRAGVTAAAMSDWYQSAPKSDPFAEPTESTVASPENQRSVDAQAANRDFPEAGGTREESAGRSESSAHEAASATATESTSSTRLPGTESRQVVLRNADSDLSVAFVVDGRVFVLQPGASLQWGITRELTVDFDRGGTFGAARENLRPGTYVFRVNASGWRLLPDSIRSAKPRAKGAETDAQAGRSSS